MSTASRVQGTRTEHDSLGSLQVPQDALYGAQTQRAVENFGLSSLRMPPAFLKALALVKASAAASNAELGLLDAGLARAIIAAAEAVASGEHLEHFPVDVFQTGSGTSTNMNANEVIARLASRAAGLTVHPNDHVNMSQSSNDVIPTTLHLAAALQVRDALLPSLKHLVRAIEVRGRRLGAVVKTGRTHLMDAMPLTLAQELGGWAQQVRSGIERIESTRPRLHRLAQGGTAVGTGINAHPRFGRIFARDLSRRARLRLTPAADYFEALSAQDTAVELSGQLKVIACSMMKISNDLRWMNSGPLAGLGEIALPTLQPGSSIMPGKVNPVIPEAVAMASAQVMGNDVTITVAGQSGNFQLNVMLPVIAYNLLQSVELCASAARALADRAIRGFTINRDALDAALARNPILVTALNRAIGYERGAQIAKQAYAQGRPVRDVALELTDLSSDELDRLLDPALLARGGLPE